MIFADKITEDFYNDTQDVTDAVKEIIADVRQNGNSAVKKYSEKFDGIENYLSKQLGVIMELRQKLRELYLER